MGITEEVTSAEGFEDIWNKLNHNQRRFVIARLEHTRKSDAAKEIDIAPETVYRWPDYVDEAVDYLMSDVKDRAFDILQSGVLKAAMLKLEGLEYEDNDLQQKIASEVLDRVLGRATSKAEIMGAGGAPMQISIIKSNIGDNDL